MFLKHTPTPGDTQVPTRVVSEATYLSDGHTHPASLGIVSYELQRK